MVRRCHCNVNHWHTGGVDLQKASQARLNSLNKSARQLLQPRTTPETKPQRWGFFFGRWPCCGWLAYPWAGGLPGVRAGARVPPDRHTARPWVCGVLAGLPRGQVACLACVSVPVGGAVGRVPAWWPCWCWCAYPWAAGLPGGRAVASASPCPGDSPTAHPVQFSKAIMKEWHATCNPHKTCLIDHIYFEARQVARYDHTRAATLPDSPP